MCNRQQAGGHHQSPHLLRLTSLEEQAGDLFLEPEKIADLTPPSLYSKWPSSTTKSNSLLNGSPSRAWPLTKDQYKGQSGTLLKGIPKQVLVCYSWHPRFMRRQQLQINAWSWKSHVNQKQTCGQMQQQSKCLLNLGCAKLQGGVT